VYLPRKEYFHEIVLGTLPSKEDSYPLKYPMRQDYCCFLSLLIVVFITISNFEGNIKVLNTRSIYKDKRYTCDVDLNSVWEAKRKLV
jgi:hypothetical protein